MPQLSDLLNRVHDEHPAVPEPLALRALSDSAKEFFNRTHVWVETLVDPILIAGSAKLVLQPGAGRVVAALREVFVDGREMEPVPTFDRRMYERGMVPRIYVQWSPAMIELNMPPMPGARFTIKAAISLAAEATDTEIPADVMDEYGEYIAMGAKMRLVRQAGQPWFNPEIGVMYGGSYYNAIAAAKRRATSALDQADLQVEMRSW